MKSIQKGKAVSQGIGIGRVYIYKQYVPNIIKEIIEQKDISKEVECLINTQRSAKLEIESVRDLLLEKNDKQSMIFDAHLEMIADSVVNTEIKKLIEINHFSYQYAISSVYDKYINMLSKVEDELIKERVADLIDVKNRLLRISEGVEESNISALSQPTIVIAKDLYPSDIATIDKNNIQAIVTEIGGMTSHAAIIAKSYEIPAIFGVEHVFDEFKNNEWMIVDAIHCMMISNPDSKMLEAFKNKQKDYMFKQEITKKYINARPITIDDQSIDVSLNISSVSEEEIEFEPYVDGVGLFRSEFLYMNSKHAPTEEEQYQVYKKALIKFKNKPVVLRTLDIGGDKEVSYLNLPKEVNPFLGSRAIRLCFDHMDLFKVQLRAALRASVFGNLWLMFPMVGSLDDIYKIKSIIEDIKKELTDQKIQYSSTYKFGIMIEIPSIIMVADHVAEIVDFASIGTNDLCQYLFAVDRMNPLVNQYYQSYSPSMFRIIKIAIDAFAKANKPLSVCGESGGDLIAAPVLLGLGIRKLSMNHSSISRIKRLITSYSMEELKDVSNHILTLKTEKEAIDYIKFKFNLEE